MCACNPSAAAGGGPCRGVQAKGPLRACKHGLRVVGAGEGARGTIISEAMGSRPFGGIDNVQKCLVALAVPAPTKERNTCAARLLLPCRTASDGGSSGGETAAGGVWSAGEAAAAASKGEAEGKADKEGVCRAAGSARARATGIKVTEALFSAS